MVPRVSYTPTVDFIKAISHHTLSFGFMGVSQMLDGGHFAVTTLPFAASFTQGPDPQHVTNGTGAGFASFLVGAGGSVAGANGPGTGFNQFPAMNKKYLGWYLQDDWKMGPKLTLNLGVRYEIQTAPTERVNAQEYFDFKALNPISSDAGFPVYGAITYNNDNNRSLYNTQHLNFAPRVGAAYQVSSKLVGRAGFGIFYVPNYYNQGPNLGFSQPTPWVNSLDGITVDHPLSDAFPNGQVPVTGNSLGQLTGVGFSVNPVTDPHRPSAYVEQWMGGVQYSPTNNDMIDITSTRRNTFNLHPPEIVFLLLFIFSGGAAFLGGYSMAVHGRSWFHMFALAIAVTLTIYATLEIEFPRRGLIRLKGTDKTLIELRNSMN